MSLSNIITWSIIFFLLLKNNIALSNNLNCMALKTKAISTPGCYYLTENIKETIIINSDNVILDLNEKKLSDPNPGSQNIGILLGNHNNITIKNGYFDGFWFAIAGSGGRNLRVINNLFINTKYVSIVLSGSNIQVRGNYITYMDFSQPKNEVDFYLVGLNVRDTSGCNISNNVVSAPSIPKQPPKYRLEYVGLILSSESINCRIENNIFSNFQSPPFKSIAVWLASGTANNYLRSNLILNYQYGITAVSKNYTEKNNLFLNVEKLKWNKVIEPPELLSGIQITE
ncbi:TPA: hypothetical protein ACT9AM_002855 [Legionella pneumophila]|nr:hypothetical protein [Legionella pneumophila serogroup 14]HAT1901211.1 hypothetical protein [Legionella pneumophila]HDO9975772.1 hypothetical protein [Legionella pneumophila]